MTQPVTLSLEEAKQIAGALDACSSAAVEKARKLTKSGKNIDGYQVVSQCVAYAATEACVAQKLADFAAARAQDTLLGTMAGCGIAELAVSIRGRLSPVLDDLGMTNDDLAPLDAVDALVRRGNKHQLFCDIGRQVADNKGKNRVALDDMLEQVRDSVRQFADKEVAPHAERIHVHDELVPQSFIDKMSELGFFGLSVPEDFGGHELGNLAMILTTEELSRASLAAAGSLITRPEILAKALLSGGTDAQKKHWLPKIASGELMVGISVTEPNVGSNVAALSCKASRATVDGVDGWLLDGAKSWCTFAGRANILAVLARTDPDASKGAKGLSLFIVPKDAFDGHEFVCDQASGGRLEGKADRTPGYRGMHSFTLSFDKYFVPGENLIGESAGEGRGFYLQMAGFAAGRLQTGGRACGLAQAALEKTAEYVSDRSQFGAPIIDFELTQHRLGRMATQLAGARAITYAAAEAMDEDERAAATIAAQAKLYACDVAVEITQSGQLLHGGWGYAEEYPISRYVVDALVLPIFEGVKPVLELKVVARSLFA